MDWAEPFTIAMAASTESQLRSGIFLVAISRICAVVTLPDLAPLPGVCEPDLDARRLLQEEGDRRQLHLEGEGPVLIGRDDDRDRHALRHLRGARVEGLAEFHDVEAALAERGADRRRRIRGPRRHLQLDVTCDLLRHVCSPGRVCAAG